MRGSKGRGAWAACALTLGNLICGFAAIILAVQGYHEEWLFRQVPAVVVQGAWFLFLGMLLDGFDGRVARMTKADGAFGAELDSLADMISFGLAPAVLAWVVGVRTQQPPALLWAVGSLYVASAALRLARYNVQHASPRRAKSPDFEGMPSPAAAGLVVGLILLGGLEDLSPQIRDRALLVLPALVGAAGLLMVSRIPYIHVLSRLGRAKAFLWPLGLLFAALLAFYPALTLSVAFLGYALGGLLLAGLGRLLPRGEAEDDWVDDQIFRR